MPRAAAEPQTTAPPRLATLDIARTLALAAMVVFHTARDLEMFALVPPGMTLGGGWALFARLIAGSFLFLAGVSLYLAHGRGIRWRAFLWRACVLAAAALAVTLATRIAMPDAFIFFGILHSILVCTTIGLVFLRLPAALTLAAAVAVVVAAGLVRAPAFDAPWLLWTGLGTIMPRTLDYEPVFPWLAPCLAGIAAARIATRAGLAGRLQRAEPSGRWIRLLAWPGRHSLAVYLVHQPILIGLIWLGTRLS